MIFLNLDITDIKLSLPDYFSYTSFLIIKISVSIFQEYEIHEIKYEKSVFL